MKRRIRRLGLVLGMTLLAGGAPRAQEVTLASLLREMGDLERLTRTPVPPYRTVQFSSFDRRSVAADRPGWFSNADGFGNEPVPGFEKVLDAPGNDGAGRYLVCEVKGPGALVRGWTAGIDGTFTVVLDGAAKPLYVGPAADFLRKRFHHFAGPLGAGFDPGGAFQQEDADYFPVPFARGLRIEYEGDIKKLHFYQVGVRLYAAGTRVETFRPEGMAAAAAAIREAAERLNRPPRWRPGPGERELAFRLAIPPGEARTVRHDGPGAVRALVLQARAAHLRTALRATVLRIRFDGATVPQVEAPLGDFFGAAPGVNPYASLPMTVRADGTMICRFVMPFRSSMKLDLQNTGPEAVAVVGRAGIGAYRWDEGRSLHFRARWRVDHGLFAGDRVEDVMDVPVLIALGAGRYVGTAVSVVNPCPCPSAWGNWWGEGDEKVFVDGEARPSTFGTGTEDYFDYSWSRSHLFAHPYAVQPRASGPDHRGYVANIRWHILDDLPFRSSLEFRFELWHHTPTPGFSWARIGYHYGRPGLRDDHPPLARADLRVPALPAWTPLARLGSKDATFYPAEACRGRAEGRREIVAGRRYAGGKALRWAPAGPGAKLRLDFEVANRDTYLVVLTCGCSPRAGKVKVRLDDRRLAKKKGDRWMADLATEHQERLRNFVFEKTEIDAGVHTLTLEAAGKNPGEIVLDTFWIKPEKP